VQPLAKDFPIEFEGKNLSLESVPLEIKQRRLYVGEHQQYVTFRPTVLYDNEQEVNLLDDGSLFSYDAQGIQLFERDYDSEQSFVFLLESLHPNFKEASQQTFYSLRLEDMKANFWFLKAFEMLREQGVHIFGLNELKNLNYSPHTPSISIKMGSSQDWFETKLEVAFGNTKVKIRDLKKAVKAGNGYIELSDGSLGILPEEWLKKFERLFRSGRISKEKLHIPKTNFNLVDEFIEPGQHRDIFREIEEKKARLREFKGLKQAPVPRGLKASLRHYQQEGLNWLNFLSEFGWGGILADDMGLGKTLQAIALICQELELRPDLPNLVVAPTTLLFNWRNELDKFAPKLDYIIHHGQRTQTLEELSEHKLILTSYGVLINDLELLNKLSFNIIIADESQAFKNVHSKRYQSIVQLKGRLRLALTGTPIENNLFELYAQMNFANPAFFVDMASFRENYVKPIQQDNNEYMREELKKKISPFLLRRTKQEVLRELPEKTEDYLYCGMGAEQRRCYDAYRNEYRDYLLKKFDEEGVEKSQMYVLEGLTRLRQICDAPQLVDSGYAPKHSAKLQELLLHVQEKTGRHKMLVFSQYVKMLQLVEQEFKQNDIEYAYLDGQTSLQERERQVQYFQENTECRVFLISLKAGGSGLNLTAADYVYLLDPWWNPAVESQAIDRCYRMGQDKKVMAYRMICQDTVEEKIIALQQKKKQLSDDVLGGGDSALSKLSREDILELFS
jgi:SNF2 family DNA or RNA helicase